ncbi:MAG: LruC domain-containing protein [Muribaculaceae bacterium]|nr:LruC domain-containing protein [Muribaculaceae bacterium]
MRTNSAFKIVILGIISFLLASCVEKSPTGYNESYGNEDYINSFKNTNEITFKVESETPGKVYSVFYKYPYSEGDLVETPFLTAKTPISVKLIIPKDVTTLYVLSDGEITEHKVASGDFILTANRSSHDFNDLATIAAYVNSTVFPEQSNNIKGEDLYKCTDLVISESEASGYFEEAEAWITYLSDGGFSNSNQHGKLWFYTYDSAKRENLTVDDCTFYGLDADGNKEQISYSDINSSNSKYVFYSSEENKNVKNGVYTKKYLGKFHKGLNIGFVFKSENERAQFTTPSLNLSEGNYKYIGTKFNYKNNQGSFTPIKSVSNGFIYHLITDDFQVNVLGMENRSTNHKSYDGDYNDMLCIIESNPIYIKPVEEIFPPKLEEYSVEKGLYLFEDNYPSQGDFDFNDLVVAYDITSFINGSSEKGVRVKTTLLAYGSAFDNEFGFKYGEEYFPIFKNIKGHANVNDKNFDANYEKTVETDFPANAIIKPYLNNGVHYITSSDKNTEDYPYVLVIPSANNASSTFRWCLENKNISDAYNFASPRTNDWYLTPKDESLVIKR